MRHNMYYVFGWLLMILGLCFSSLVSVTIFVSTSSLPMTGVVIVLSAVFTVLSADGMFTKGQLKSGLIPVSWSDYKRFSIFPLKLRRILTYDQCLDLADEFHVVGQYNTARFFEDAADSILDGGEIEPDGAA